MCLSFPRDACGSRESFRGPCAGASVGESSLPRRDGVGVLAEAARGNAAVRLLRGAVYLCAGASGGGVVHWLVASGFVGRRDAFVDAGRCAAAMPMRCAGCFVPSWHAAVVRGGFSARYYIVSLLVAG